MLTLLPSALRGCRVTTRQVFRNLTKPDSAGHIRQSHCRVGGRTPSNPSFYNLITRRYKAGYSEALRQRLSTVQSRAYHSSRQLLQDISANAKNGEAVKRTPKRSDAKRLLALAEPEKYKIAAAIGLLVISSGVTMAVPFCLGRVIDIIYTASQEGELMTRLNSFSAILIAVFVLGAVANFGRSYLMLSSGQRIVARVREGVYSAILRQDTAFFDRSKTGELVNRLSTDTTLLGNAVTQNVSDGLRSTAQAIGGVGMMFYVCPKLAMISLAIVPPVMGFSVFYGRYVRKLTKRVQDSLADATHVAEERLSSMRTVRAFSQEGAELSRYSQRVREVLDLSYKDALARGAFWGLMGLSGNVIVLSVFYFGGVMMQESAITVGQLSSFLLYAVFTGASVNGLSGFYTELNRGLGASSRLFQMLDRQPSIPLDSGRVLAPGYRTSLELRDVHFTYPARPDAPVFSGLDLAVKAGQVTAVVGPSGSGKSTVASLLLRLYDPDQGVVSLDGHDLRDLNPTWLRQQMGTVDQEPTLFSCTVAENIAYGASDPSRVSAQQIEEAARSANALAFIKNFPDGFDTLVGERGVMLSGGQKQRIAIARAILADPAILLLDEATSALDAESEHLVQSALDELTTGRTVLTIAHRLSTIRAAAAVAVLDGGRLAEMGTYNQLLATPGGLFRKLVERQTIVQ